MRFILPNAPKRLLIAGAMTFIPLAAAYATDLYDSLKAWEKQAAEEQKYRASHRAAPSIQPDSPAPTDSGAQGPIRSEMSNEQPALESVDKPAPGATNPQQSTPSSGETDSQQPLNGPRTPSP